MMKRIYPIFVGNRSKIKDYSDAINWCYENLSSPYVLVLQEEELYSLQCDSNILDIINEENDSILQVNENDWIESNEIKRKILNRLIDYSNEIMPTEINKILLKIIYLFEISIKSNEILYFHF